MAYKGGLKDEDDFITERERHSRQRQQHEETKRRTPEIVPTVGYDGT